MGGHLSARRPRLLPALARVAAAGALGLAARDERLAHADERARSRIYRTRTDALDAAMPVATDLGSTYAMGTAAAVLFAAGRSRLARDVIAAGGLAWVLAQAAKPLFRRARPYQDGSVEIFVRRPAGLSYPSGHPAVAAAVSRVLGDGRVREPVRSLVSRAPRIVAFSRVYVGVHYPTDVIGGLLLGRGVGDLWLRYARR